MLFLMTLTLIQGHTESTKVNNQCCMLSVTKQVISITLATTVGHFYVTLTLTLQTFIWLVSLVLSWIWAYFGFFKQFSMLFPFLIIGDSEPERGSNPEARIIN